MDVKSLRAIAKVMDEYGIAHFKSGDLELTMRTGIQNVRVQTPKAAPVAVPIDSPVQEEKPIEHKNLELTSVMKLSDTELVDSLFPDYTQEAESA